MTGLAPALCVGYRLPYSAESPQPPATLFQSHVFGNQTLSSFTVAAQIIYLGLDVHKDSVTISVLTANATAPTRIDKYPNDFAKRRCSGPVADLRQTPASAAGDQMNCERSELPNRPSAASIAIQHPARSSVDGETVLRLATLSPADECGGNLYHA